MSVTITALLSAVAGLIGLIAGHLLTELRNRRRELSRVRLDAYADFLNAVSRLAAARRTGVSSNDIKDLAALNDAKARICICGDMAVVEALAEFWEAGGTLELELGIVTFSRLCMRMRESLSLPRHDVAHLNLSNTLFRLEPSEYSFRAENPERYEEARKRRDAVL